MQEGITYLEAAFGKITRELDCLEEKVHLVIGLVFKRHKFSVNDLLESFHFDKIKSLSGKISDDIKRWEAAGKLPHSLKQIYNENAELIQKRFDAINCAIQERKPTIWELVGKFFISFYRVIKELLPVIFIKLIGGKAQKFLAKAA
jgi:hypothetical protein